jgi:hypothetical protein
MIYIKVADIHFNYQVIELHFYCLSIVRIAHAVVWTMLAVELIHQETWPTRIVLVGLRGKASCR